MDKANCSVPRCERHAVRRSWCMLHYNRWNRTGAPGPAGFLCPPPGDIWSRIIKAPSGCWLWTSAINEKGYGHFTVGGTKHSAHRFVYELLVGPIPEGLVIDHLCRVRNCVNPVHMQPVTNLENLARGIGPNARAIRENTCLKGHPLVGENVYIRPSRPGSRICRICHREQKRATYWRKKVKEAAAGPGGPTASPSPLAATRRRWVPRA